MNKGVIAALAALLIGGVAFMLTQEKPAKKMATPNAKVRSRQKAKLKDSGSIDDALNLILNS